uniref:polysaccharide pyruvyl transferase family protein n=1 Tax=Agathobacter sp. TaxID=2021311 RepID=UPI0040567131
MQNYGNRLQNYAVNKFMKQFSSEVCNLNLYDLSSRDSNIKNCIKRIIPIRLLQWNVNRKANNDILKQKREHNFLLFSDKYMENKMCYVRSSKEIRHHINVDEFAYVVAGSDQIWNPDFAGKNSYFLDFVKPESRIAFSASIGYDQLPKDIRKKYTSYWNQMRYISVREDSAADIIEEATGKRPDVFLDPTLLLAKEEWDEIVQVPKCSLPKKYILCLFLGNLPEIIKNTYRKAYGMEIVVLNDKTFRDYYMLGPSEFIWLIKNAELVLTDSFHCSVFSIIYHKQFWVFEREDKKLKNMFTRMETLLGRFEMTDRVRRWDEPVSFVKLEEHRFVQADRIRNDERQRVAQVFGDIMRK